MNLPFRTIRTKLLLTFVIYASVLFAVAIFSIQQVRHSVIAAFEQTSVVFAQQIALQLRENIKEHRDFIRLIAEGDFAKELFVAYEQASTSDFPVQQMVRSRLAERVTSYEVQRGYSVIENYQVLTADGTILIDLRNTDKEGGRVDITQSPWVEADNDPGVYIGTFQYSESSGHYILPMIVTVQLNGERVGYLRQDVTEEEIVQIASLANEQFDSSKLWIVNATGQVVYSSVPYRFLEDVTDFPLFADFYSWETASVVVDQSTNLSVVGRTHLYPDRMHPEVDWQVLVSSQASNQFGTLASLTRLVSFLYAAVLVIIALGFILSLYLAYSIARPLRQLRLFVEELGQGTLAKEFPPELLRRHDEIGVLTRTFQVLANELRDLYSNLEDKVRQQTRELRIFKRGIEESSDAIIITDPDGKILYVNPAWERNNQYDAKEVLGANPRIIKSGKTPEFVYQRMWDAITRGEAFTTNDIVNQRKDGSNYNASLAVYPLLDRYGDVQFIVGIQRDITALKEVDRMKTEFISIAAHQLRTPLSAMKWLLEMLLTDDVGELTTEQKDHIRNIDLSNERMIALVNALLNVSRIESGRLALQPQPTDFKDLMQDVAKTMQKKFSEKKIDLQLQYDDAIPEVTIDDELLRNVLLNLLSNAAKYSPEETIVTLSARLQGDEVIWKVADQGYGIPSDEQDKIFEKFYRGKNIQKRDSDGTGLGLYLVLRIVEELGGRVWFESRENVGTTFWFTVPTSDMASRAGEVRLASS